MENSQDVSVRADSARMFDRVRPVRSVNTNSFEQSDNKFMPASQRLYHRRDNMFTNRESYNQSRENFGIGRSQSQTRVRRPGIGISDVIEDSYRNAVEPDTSLFYQNHRPLPFKSLS